jgi:hypothetical protein
MLDTVIDSGVEFVAGSAKRRPIGRSFPGLALAFFTSGHLMNKMPHRLNRLPSDRPPDILRIGASCQASRPEAPVEPLLLIGGVYPRIPVVSIAVSPSRSLIRHGF